MKKIVILLSLFVLTGCKKEISKPFYLKLNPNSPGEVASVFAPGVISTSHHEHSAPAISPDGAEIYWSVWEKPATENPIQKIYFIKHAVEGWSKPKVASFSGQYSDGGPCFSPDGKRLYFYSKRPVESESALPVSNDLWFVERVNNKWINPKRMSKIINDNNLQALPTLAGNNNLYFISYLENVKNNYGIYKSIFKNNTYNKPVLLPEQINSKYRDWTPFISKDERFIIFSSHRPEGFGSGDLYICFKNDNGIWGKCINLGDKINTASQERFPMLSPDGKTLFFTRATESNFDDIYWVKFDADKYFNMAQK